MITIYRSNEQGLEIRDTPSEGCWLNVVDPTPEELGSLEATLGVPRDFLTYPLDLDEQPRADREDSATLIVLRVPHSPQPPGDLPFVTIPLGIILTDAYVATVCRAATAVIQQLTHVRPRPLSTTKRNRFVLRVLLSMAVQFLSHVRQLDKEVANLEDRLERSLRNAELMELLKRQKSLVFFTTALTANEIVLQRLQRGQLFQAFPEDQDLLEDVLIEVHQAIQMTGISSNILSQMMDAFASIISNNLNVVMKFMASMTIVLTVPMLVATVYGMNVDLPLASFAGAFPVVVGGSLLASLAVVLFFWRRDWL